MQPAAIFLLRRTAGSAVHTYRFVNRERNPILQCPEIPAAHVIRKMVEPLIQMRAIDIPDTAVKAGFEFDNNICIGRHLIAHSQNMFIGQTCKALGAHADRRAVMQNKHRLTAVERVKKIKLLTVCADRQTKYIQLFLADPGICIKWIRCIDRFTPGVSIAIKQAGEIQRRQLRRTELFQSAAIPHVSVGYQKAAAILLDRRFVEFGFLDPPRFVYHGSIPHTRI